MLDYATIVIVVAIFATINELYGIVTNLVLWPHLSVADSISRYLACAEIRIQLSL